MNAPRCSDESYVNFLIASQGRVSCSETRRVQPRSPFAPAHDSFTRLLQRLEPDPNALWTEAEPTIDRARGALILDTRQALRQAHRLGDPHWSGKHRKTVRGINLITLLGTDGDRKIPCDYRLYSKTDGKTKNYHFWEMMLMARGRGFSPKYVLFDSWYVSLKVPGTADLIFP